MKKMLFLSALIVFSQTVFAENAIGILSPQDEIVATKQLRSKLRVLYPNSRTEQEAWDQHVKKINLPAKLSRTLPDIIINPNLWRYFLLNKLADQLQPFANKVGASEITIEVTDDPSVNAKFLFRAPDGPSNYHIQVYKGLINHPNLTPDALRYVVCHEVGHGSGGYPFYTAPANWKDYKVAAEGQADYFAASRCMHFLLKDDASGNANALASASTDVKNACTVMRRLPTPLPLPIPGPGRPVNPPVVMPSTVNPICVRTLQAAVTVFNGLLGASVVASSEDPATTAVTNTVSYPSTTCRIQTARYGSQCGSNPDDFFTRPGTSAYDSDVSNEHTIGDNETCWVKSGTISLVRVTRPPCWFKQAVNR